jgi:hypothetical protein
MRLIAQPHNSSSFLHWLSLVSLCTILFSSANMPSLAQMIGTTKPLSTAADDENDKIMRMLSKLSERLTTQDLNLRKIVCQEQVLVERSANKGGAAGQMSRDFVMSGEKKLRGSFSSDSTFVETHTPAAADPGATIAESLLVRESFTAASEFFGLNHAESYAQRLVGPQKWEGRDAFIVSFQTVNQLEMRQITINGKTVPMRLAGQAWLDATSGALLRLEVRQLKLPKGVHDFSYDIHYSREPRFVLPATVIFKRTSGAETVVTTQTFSNCKVD